MRSLLIINPTSGQGKAAREKKKLLDYAAAAAHMRTVITSGPEDAAETARKAAHDGYDLIIAAGGDGTINQVINGIGDSGIPLGIVPLGTGNVLAHDLGIPVYNTQKALDVIRKGKTRHVDIARAEDRRFILMAGLGFDAAVIDSVSPKVKDVLGTVAYAPAIIEQLVKFSPAHFRLTFNDKSVYETDAYAVIAANCGTYAHNFKIARQAIFDDGMLDILVFEAGARTAINLVGQALDTIFQGSIAHPSTSYFRAAKVHVESEPSVRMQLDGDLHGESDVDIEVVPKALSLIVP
ncbi:diacylglycerol kinase family lipid kinase [bacterium]|nr:diacylglycerol kinase family lipid kinase [bacterium]